MLDTEDELNLYELFSVPTSTANRELSPRTSSSCNSFCETQLSHVSYDVEYSEKNEVNDIHRDNFKNKSIEEALKEGSGSAAEDDLPKAAQRPVQINSKVIYNRIQGPSEIRIIEGRGRDLTP